MISEREAKQIVKDQIRFGREVVLFQENEEYYVFDCDNGRLTPSGSIVVVDKRTGETGTSILSVEKAVSRMRDAKRK